MDIVLVYLIGKQKISKFKQKMKVLNYCSIENQLKALRAKEMNAARKEDYLKAAEYRDKQITIKEALTKL